MEDNKKKYVINNKELMSEWDEESNIKEGFYPNKLTLGSSKKVNWKCHKNHKWKATIYNRSLGTNCPYCCGKIPVVGENDLASTHPEIASQLHPTLNGNLTSKDITAGSNKKLWWVCKEGHEWQSTVSNRIKNNGCPYCSGRFPILGKTDLETTNPEIAKQLHPFLNNDVTAKDISSGSNKELWWICNNSHIWKAPVYSRTNGSGCPYCNGRIENNLLITHPEIVKQLHPSMNGNVNPESLTAGSDKKLFWTCEKNHTWEASIKSRTAGKGCSHCSKSKIDSKYEKIICYYMNQIFKDCIPNAKVFGKKELDIFLPSINLGIEYDGPFHKLENDIDKNKLCKEKNILLVRVRTHGLPKLNSSSVDFYLDKRCSYESLDKAIKNIIKLIIKKYGQDIIIDINSKRDELKAMQYQKLKNIEKSIAFTHPEISKQIHPTKNGKLTGEMFSAGSAQKLYWKCDKGHSWKATINSRVDGHNCPYCSGNRLLKNENDLLTLCPQISKIWDKTKNGELTPDLLKPNSNKKIWIIKNGCSKEITVRALTKSKYFKSL